MQIILSGEVREVFQKNDSNLIGLRGGKGVSSNNNELTCLILVVSNKRSQCLYILPVFLQIKLMLAEFIHNLLSF